MLLEREDGSGGGNAASEMKMKGGKQRGVCLPVCLWSSPRCRARACARLSRSTEADERGAVGVLLQSDA